MKNIDYISIAHWAEKSNKLLDTVRNIYRDFDINDTSIPESAFNCSNPVSLVFAGQYSAGKSTILKALTGFNDIVVKEGIATLETHKYEWNGMTVIDTPGICTELRPEHDEIALNAITHADMLIYVVTYNLFDGPIGNEFRNLIINNDKAKETILIVNKMADIGNTEENRTIKREALREVTSPYSPENLRTCFVDAESYIDSKAETDKEVANMLLERSNFSELVNTINKFVSEKALSARLTTSLYKVIDSLQMALKKYLPSSGDEDIDALEESQLRQKSILSSTIRNLESTVKQEYKDASEKIRDLGRKFANSIDSFTSQSEIDDAFQDAKNQVDKISDNCLQEIENSINNILDEYNVELNDFYNSSFTKKLYNRLEMKEFKDSPVIRKIVEKDALSKSGAFIVKNAGGADKGIKGLSGFAGTNAHKVVLDIGHFFGHSFRPWEAVKIAKGINVAGKLIGIFGTIFSVAIQAKDDYDTEERVKEQRNVREEIRASFNTAAEELEKHFSSALSKMIKSSLAPKLEDVELSIQAIRESRTDNSDKCKRLIKIETECRQLIRDIHESNV